MKIKEDFRQLASSASHNCFACSPVNEAGLQMKFFTNKKTVFSRVTIPSHLCGWNNVAHGGVVSTILDEIMSWAAMYLLKRIVLTESMTVEFIKPVIKTGGRGDIYFLTLRGRGRNRHMKFDHGFLDIAEVKQVADLMRQTFPGK